VSDQDKRQRIMQAAEKLFSSRRFHEITTDEVAREAKVGKGTIYLYFRDKDDLFFETANSGFDELCDLLREKVSQKAPFRRQILQACVQIGTFFQRRREMFDMMQSEDCRLSLETGRLRDRWLRKRKKLVEALAAILECGLREGALRADVPPDVLANFLLGMLRTRARDLADCPEPLRRYELVVEVFCRGAESRGGNGNHASGPTTLRNRAPQIERTSHVQKD
jgi:AcrR family transcriptional regulator